MRFSLCVVVLPFLVSACFDATQSKSKADSLSPVPVTLNKTNQATPIEKEKQAVSSNQLKATRAKLTTLTDDLSCDNLTQCHVLPVGSKACGGPSSYVVFSSKNTEKGVVELLAKKITTLESQFNVKTGMVSTCQHLSEPAAQCKNNKCVKIEGNATSVY